MPRLVVVLTAILVALCIAGFLATTGALSGRAHIVIGIVAGAFTGFGETMLMFPFENVKTQQQLHRGALIDVVRRTLRLHGVVGLYRGIVPVLLGAIPSQGLRWGAFTAYCGRDPTGSGRSGCTTLWDTFVAALVAGITVSVLIGVPIETLKTEAIHRLHGDGSHQPTASSRKHNDDDDANAEATATERSPHVIITFDQLEGVSPTVVLPPTGGGEALGSFSKRRWAAAAVEPPGGLTPRRVLQWRGWAPTVLKKMLNQGIRFPTHHYLLATLCGAFVGPSTFATRMIAKDGHTLAARGDLLPCRASDHLLLTFIAGALAGLSSIVATQPLDVVKTRMQGLHAGRFRHAFHCGGSVVREEGWSALFDGIAARSLRASLGAALTFTVFPLAQYWLHMHFDGKP